MRSGASVSGAGGHQEDIASCLVLGVFLIHFADEEYQMVEEFIARCRSPLLPRPRVV